MKFWGRWNKDFQRIHHAKIGVTITWLWDGGVDLRLLREGGAVAAEYRTSCPCDSLPEWPCL
jgi:hypothetical protein